MVENLEVLFSSSARVQVMHLFLSNPDRRFYQREIERETGQPIRAVQREVQRLTEINLLSRSSEGNRVFYGLDPDFPLLAELTALFQASAATEKEEGVPERPPAVPRNHRPFSSRSRGCKLPSSPRCPRRCEVYR